MSKNVSFRRDSPPGGSHYDHQRSDSGVGSFSGDESRSSRADRPYTPSDYESPVDSVYVLQQAFERERLAKERWKKKATELDAQVTQSRKDFKEKEAQWRAATDRNEILDQEKTALLQRIAELSDELAKSKEEKEKRSSHRKSNSPPLVSGAVGVESSDDKKPRRSNSKRAKESDRVDREREKRGIDREIERELERENREKDRETERLRKRFDSRAEESDAKSSNSSSKSHRSRRDSYIEPLGHGAPRPSVQVPASPAARPYPSYPAAAPFPQQPYATSNPPRSAHPSVMVYQDAFVDDEDGSYHHYPLPTHKSSRRGDRV